MQSLTVTTIQHNTTNQPTIYLPQLKQIAIRTLQTTVEGYQRSHTSHNK